MIAVVTDLGGRVPGLHVGVGLYAPNAYPFRDMNTVNGKPFFIPNDAGSYDFPASFEGRRRRPATTSSTQEAAMHPAEPRRRRIA